MSEKHPLALRFLLHDAKPESTKLTFIIEVEVATRHHIPPPLKPRTKGARYASILNPRVAYHVDADLGIRVYCNGELLRETTEVEGDIDMIERERKAALDYLHQNLAEELNRAVTVLCDEACLQISSPAERERIIKQKVGRAEAAIRKRLPLAPNIMTKKEKERFFEQALDAIEEVRKEKLHYNRTNIAAKMYPENSNPLQELRRQATRARLHNPRRKGDFDDLLWILSNMYCVRIGNNPFRVEGHHELRWDESALEK
jgi:hypothetical protein